MTSTHTHTHSTTHNGLSVGGGLEHVSLLWAGGWCWWTGRALRSRGERWQDRYNSERHWILIKRRLVAATWCFCVHFGPVRARHFARKQGFSAFLLVQAGFQQHGASQWDGTSETRQGFVRGNQGRRWVFSRQNECCQLGAILVAALSTNKNFFADFVCCTHAKCTETNNAVQLQKTFKKGSTQCHFPPSSFSLMLFTVTELMY